MSQEAPTQWWTLEPGEALSRLKSNEKGLSPEDVGQRRETYGPNALPRARTRSIIQRLWAQFQNALIYVLLVSAVITAMLGHVLDTAVILGVVVINALIGVLQEGKAERALSAISTLLSPQALVRREGVNQQIDATELVPGDVVVLQAGDRIPADLRLFASRELLIDEALLTGESNAIEKTIDAVEAKAPLAERQGMAYSGTLVSAGTGLGLVVGTGLNTEIGRISGLMEDVELITTPLLRQVSRFATSLSIATLLIAVATFLFGWLVRDYSSTEMFVAAVGLAVAAIPEGLPAILTITLAIGVQHMARRNAIVRQLPAVETLGSVTVICTDKTGTLTRNEMTVTDIVMKDAHHPVSGVGYEPEGTIGEAAYRQDTAPNEALSLMIQAGLLCNDASLSHHEGQWQIQGDPTEGALVTLAAKYGLDAASENSRVPRLDEIPFSSEARFMATLNHDHHGHHFAILKGAPERVIELCALQYQGESTAEIDQRWWSEQSAQLAAEGKRVLALARLDFDQATHEMNVDDLDHRLALLGLVAMVDPPRPEAIHAVKTARDAGIQVKMITGDHGVTAAAIARQMGLGQDSEAVTGTELDGLDDASLAELAKARAVFARTSPEHKLRLVKALQASGEVVAMTGDGVNDAPALKRADVGVAMGRKGTEAAKQAARIVLADDNFKTIVDAVEAGRVVYDNLKKGIAFVLPTSGGEALSILLAILLGVTLLITPVQILWINMVTAITLAITLGFEPAEDRVMQRTPRSPGEALLSRFLVWRVVFVSVLMVLASFGLYLWYLESGSSLAEARTMAVNTLVFCEIVYLFNTRVLQAPACRMATLFSNIYAWIAVAVLLILQMLFTYAPFMQQLFGTQALGPLAWLHIVLGALALFVIVELEKWWFRYRGDASSAGRVEVA